MSPEIRRLLERWAALGVTTPVLPGTGPDGLLLLHRETRAHLYLSRPRRRLRRWRAR